MSAKQEMLNRLANVAKNAPLQESSATKAEEEANAGQHQVTPEKAARPARKAKNLHIPEDLWDAYQRLKDTNTTSLLMTGYILEAFREKLAKDGAFDSANRIK